MHLLRMPKASENMSEGTVGPWRVSEGERVAAGQPVVELITDKAEFELESEADGLLLRVVAAEGSTVPVNYVLGVVGEAGEDPSAVDAENEKVLAAAREQLAGATVGGGAAPRQDAREGQRPARSGQSGRSAVRATPAARRLAKEHGLDLAAVRDRYAIKGAVRESDVSRFSADIQGGQPGQAGPTGPAAKSGGPNLGSIAGIGVDLIEVRRIERLIERRGEKFLRRIFTPVEIEYCQAHKQAGQHFAARFAVKEAVFKALGTGWAQGVSWRQVETVNETSGQPRARLAGRARERADALGVRTVHVSISHSDEYAVAYVILER